MGTNHSPRPFFHPERVTRKDLEEMEARLLKAIKDAHNQITPQDQAVLDSTLAAEAKVTKKLDELADKKQTKRKK